MPIETSKNTNVSQHSRKDRTNNTIHYTTITMKVVYFAFCLSLVLGNVQRAFGFSQTALNRGKQTSSNGSRLQQTTEDHGIVDENSAQLSRRAFAGSAAVMAVLAGMAPSAGAAPTIATAADGSLPDLPNEAVRSYLQYRIPLQIAADYYVFALQDMIGDIDQWGDVGQLFRVNNNKGQGQPSKIGRLFIFSGGCNQEMDQNSVV